MRPLHKIIVAVFLISLLFIFINFYYLDGWRGLFFKYLITKTDTVYAPGYSDGKFRKIRKGMDLEKVLEILGEPLGEVLMYEVGPPDGYEWKDEIDGLFFVYLENDIVDYISAYSLKVPECLEIGMKKEEILDLVGIPYQKSLAYSKTPRGNSYSVRVIILENDVVTEVMHHMYFD